MTVNLLGSMIFLVGVTGIYHAAGTLDFGLAEQTLRAQDEPIPLFGAMLLTALSLKLGLFPFHGWVPLLYSHARPAITAALAGALVNIGAYGLLRIGLAVFPETVQRADLLLLGLGAAATVYGALLAVARRNPAELAAYLAITQAGYVMLGFGLGTEQGIVAVLLVVLTGSIDKTMMFLALDRRGWSRGAAAFVAAISTAGLPVTLGFLAKVQLFHAGAAASFAPLVIGSLLIATPLTIAATVRYWRLAHTAPPPVVERLGRPIATLALVTISVVLGLAPQGLSELVGVIGAELATVGP
jgi:multicomponent Na+:H+ antiporter subunit D